MSALTYFDMIRACRYPFGHFLDSFSLNPYFLTIWSAMLLFISPALVTGLLSGSHQNSLVFVLLFLVNSTHVRS